MFQWLYDFFMTYIMPLFASILSFLGVDSKKSVHFEDAVKGGELTDGPITAPTVNESA
jgi:hypothetical protein